MTQRALTLLCAYLSSASPDDQAVVRRLPSAPGLDDGRHIDLDGRPNPQLPIVATAVAATANASPGASRRRTIERLLRSLIDGEPEHGLRHLESLVDPRRIDDCPVDPADIAPTWPEGVVKAVIPAHRPEARGRHVRGLSHRVQAPPITQIGRSLYRPRYGRR